MWNQGTLEQEHKLSIKQKGPLKEREQRTPPWSSSSLHKTLEEAIFWAIDFPVSRCSGYCQGEMNSDRLQWRGHELLKELARRMDTRFLKTGELCGYVASRNTAKGTPQRHSREDVPHSYPPLWSSKWNEKSCHWIWLAESTVATN